MYHQIVHMNFPKTIIVFQEIRELNRRVDGSKLVMWGKMSNAGSLHIFIRNTTSKFISKQYNYSRVLHIRNHFLTLRPKPLSYRGTCRYQGSVPRCVQPGWELNNYLLG